MDPSPPMDGHVVVVPYPGRGHINPLMHLCNLLLSKNSNILFTCVITQEWHGFIGSDPKPVNIRLKTIPNVIPSERGRGNDMVGFLDAVMTRMEAPFEQLLDRLHPPPTFIIYDTYLFWVVGVGNRRNIPVASFFPMSASFFSVLYHYRLFEQNGHYPANLSENGDERVDYIPGLPPTRLADFPLNDGSWQSRKLLHWIAKAFQWVLKAQYLLFPSILELESQAIHALKADFPIPIYTIGPAIPHLSLKHNPSSCITDQNDPSYMKWLDTQPSGSVLYVSQGSFLSASTAQLEEIVAGLQASEVRFLWIARGENLKLKETCGNMGLVCSWCDQLRVLSHPAIGGFWSHCGWNSTREGAFAGVPFLAFPLIMDQPMNCKLIVEDWKTGWRVKKGVKEGVLVTRDEVAGILKTFMDLSSDEGRELRQRARQVQQICRLAIADGGSLETNVNAFLRDLLQCGKP
ncbi:UDP-glycosyltransferase 87A1-like [Prosopis cineraria]|uniref:UDP-glycosyltransferase 87A1-like n=1 Tax=Prosopis cineraria TaxID=364024 RepID=UPI0024106F90|nr:UDP-glycosyltransferase 87A1-like [Prosopis cineraria]